MSHSQEILGLTREDVLFIKEMGQSYRGRRWNTPLRSQEEWTHQAPDMYVAKASSSIPSASGTTPGSAICSLHRIDITDGKLHDTGATQAVYNSSTSPVASGFIQICRDKWGKWWTSAGGGGGGCGWIRFRLVAPIPNTMSAVCLVEAVEWPFTSISDVPGTSNIIIPGFVGTPTVIICDPLCSNFNDPPAGLLSRRGFAKYMQPLPNYPTVCQPGSYSYYPFEPEWEVVVLNCLLNPRCGPQP